MVNHVKSLLLVWFQLYPIVLFGDALCWPAKLCCTHDSSTCHHLEGTSAVLPEGRRDRLFADVGEPCGARLSFRDDRRMGTRRWPKVMIDVMWLVFLGETTEAPTDLER